MIEIAGARGPFPLRSVCAGCSTRRVAVLPASPGGAATLLFERLV